MPKRIQRKRVKGWCSLDEACHGDVLLRIANG